MRSTIAEKGVEAVSSPAFARLRSPSFCAMLLFFCCFAVCSALADPLIDIYSSATVTSSSVLEDEGIKFVPQWAVDRVNSRLWSCCFVSKKEMNPWWRLDLGKKQTIDLVFIDFRDDTSNHQPDVKKEDMDGFRVYVDDVSDSTTSGHTRCGSAISSFDGTKTRLSFQCPGTEGRYIHVIVKSSAPTYLALCEVFINYAPVSGPNYARYEGEYYIVQPGGDPSKPSSLAIDDNTGTCASTNDSSTLQSLSVRLPWPIFVLRIGLYTNIDNGVTYKVYAGSHLSNDGFDNPIVFNYVSAQNLVQAKFSGIYPSSFVSDITITASLSNIKLEVCEVQLLKEGSILDIYSLSSAAALSELNTSTLASKAIDNSFQTDGNACYRSAQQPGTWWRLQSMEAKAIAWVVITPLPDSTALSEMNGFSVYVGNKTTNSGKDNVMCGSPWVNPSPGSVSTIQVTCASKPVGKYVYIVASNKATSSLSLCEVQIFDCAESDPVSSGTSNDISISASGMEKLTCNATGCPTPNIVWTGPDGQIVSPATHTQTGVTVTSTIDVQGSGGGKYSCIAYNGRTSNATKEITVSVFPMITTSPMDKTVDHGQGTTLTCSGSGYPVPTITWTSPTGSSFTPKPTTVASAIATRVIDVTNQKGADGGGTFKCTASNGIGNDASAQAIISVRPKVTKVVPSTRSVVSGSTVDPVVCEAEGYPKPSVNWKLKGSTVSSSLTSNEYSVGGLSYRRGRNLTLGAVAASQNGNIYTCEAGSSTSTFTLTVTVDATFTSDPQNKYGKVGDTLSLSCEASGASAKVIEWYKDSTKISNGVSTSTANGVTSSLTLMNVQLIDGSANYYCKAGPSAGHQDAVPSSKVIVGILGSITSFESRSFHPGESSNRPFFCTFTANPRPTSGQLILDGKVEATLTQTTPKSGNSWTVSDPIQSITVEEGGDYTCVAKMGSFSIVSYAQLGITCVISVPPQASLLETGKTKSLTCSGTGYPIPSITWKKILGSQVKQVVGNESTTDSKRERTSTVTLIGDDIDQAGLYECTVMNTVPGNIQTTKASSVDVTVKPMIVTKSFSRSGTWGQSEMLTCLAIGYPLPTITWTFRGQPVTKGVSDSAAGSVNLTSTLTGTAVAALKDGGVYTCSSTNGAGNGGSIDVTLNFDPRVTTDPQSQEVRYRGALSLTCVISSYPAVSSPIRWRKDNVIQSALLSVDKLNQSTDVISTYSIMAVDENDGGAYTCNGSNQAHIAIGNTFNLDPKNESPIEGNASTLSCRVVGFPPHNITWEKSVDNNTYSGVSLGGNLNALPQRAQRSISSSLMFKAINRSDSGYYRCITTSSNAANPNQETSISARIDVYYLPSFSFDLDGGSQSVRTGASFTLTCTAVGNPLPSVDFYKTSLDLSATTTVVSGDADHQITVANGKATLIVPEAKTSDSGHYFCRASNVAGHVDSSRSALVVRGPPSRIDPGQIKESVKTGSSITFAWTAPYDGNSPILNYTISYKLDGSPDTDYKIAHVADSNMLTASLSGLKAFTDYAIRIVASNVEGPAEGTTTPKIIKTATGMPTSPRNFAVTVQSSTSVSVKWDSPSEPRGVIQNYRVYYEDKGFGRSKRALKQKTFSGIVTSATISGLAKFTRYDLYVLAVNTLNGRELVSSPSNVVPVTTEEDAPSAPQNVRGETVVDLSSMLRVVWEEPAEANGIIRNYSIFYGKKGARAILKKDVDGSITSGTLDNLDSYTLYTIQVQAFTIKGGPRSSLVEGTTDEGKPSAPLNLTVVSMDATSVELQWLAPSIPRGIITEYTIYYTGQKSYKGQGDEDGSVNEDSSRTIEGPVTSYTVVNLVADTEWTFSIAASTSKGEGDRSTTVNQMTAIAEPPTFAVPSASPDRATETTAVIVLEKPSERNGAVGRIDLLVASVANPTATVSFQSYKENDAYSATSALGSIYVAARFESRADLPNEFTLGDGKTYGGFVNGALKPGATYQYALRVYSLSDSSLVTVSEPASIATEKEPASLGLIIGVVAGVILLIIIVIIVVVVALRRKRTKRQETYAVQYSGKEEGEVEVLDSLKPTIAVAKKDFSCAPGERAVLEVDVSGKPVPLVSWRFNGCELPGDNHRVKILDSGSLQIDDVQASDAGLYKCSAKSKAGSSYGQVTLRIDTVYANTAFGNDGIPRDRFESYVGELHADNNRGFSLEYPQLDKAEKHPFAFSKKEVNKGKNRYGNIVPYDHCRVALKPLAGVPGSDYINASFLNAYQRPKGYIAAQGPNEKTVNDFWRMVWQEKVPTMVMVTNLEEKGKSKCEKYWPDSGQKTFGDVNIKLRQEIILSECIVRLLDMSQHNPDGSVSTHSTTQFHFTGWPDHGVPAYATALLNFVKRVRSHHEKVKKKGPMLVHCSAGVGRTGTFLVVDYSLQRLKKENSIDIFNLVNEFRDGRPTMVQAEAQYVFCHDAVLEYVLCGDTDVQAHNLRAYSRQLEKIDAAANKTGIQKQFELLAKVSPPKNSFSFRGGRDPQCAVKNRYAEYVPPDLSRLYLKPKAGRPANYTYINAYFADGYRRRALYVVTQGPLESTVSDFWRMVWEQHCSTIVMLTGLQENGKEMSVRYWPTKGTATYDDYSVTLEDETMFGDYGVRKLKLTDGKEDPRLIIQYHYTTWAEGRLPKNSASLIDMFSQLEKGQQKAGNHQIAVMCNNAVGRSTIFCAVSNMLERLKAEQIVDVFQVVKALRLHHPDCVSSLEHYKFLYNTALEFLDSFDTYANFKSL